MSKPDPKPLKAKKIAVFVVQRKLFGFHGETTYTEPDRVFASEDAARAYAGQLNRDIRAVGRPFDEYTNHLSARGEKALLALLTKLNLPQPAKVRVHGREHVDWLGWWDARCPDLTAAQRDAIWDALDKYDWYAVRRTTLED